MGSFAVSTSFKWIAKILVLSVATLALLITACSDDDNPSLTIYSGRSPDLIGPLLNQFAEETGIDVAVRYGGTAALTALILEEGKKSPADVFIAQDAGALGAVGAEGLFSKIDQELLELVPETYRSTDSNWIGLSGRARVIVYNTDALTPNDLPNSILEFTNPEWKGRIAWAPMNGSFQAWVTALRLSEGEDGARAWLEGIKANDVTEYMNNISIVDAVGRGAVDAGFVNHYYLKRFLAEEGEGFAARNYYTGPGDIGTLVNVAGAGILNSSDEQESGTRLLKFMLGTEAQTYYTEINSEYPLVDGVPSNGDLPSINDIKPPAINLSDLSDLQGTLDLLRSVGVLP